DRTEFGDVSAEVRAVGFAGRGRDHVALPPILDDERVFERDDLVEARAALANDAAFVVEDDRWSEIDRLRFALLRIGEARRALTVRHRGNLVVAPPAPA